METVPSELHHEEEIKFEFENALSDFLGKVEGLERGSEKFNKELENYHEQCKILSNELPIDSPRELWDNFYIAKGYRRLEQIRPGFREDTDKAFDDLEDVIENQQDESVREKWKEMYQSLYLD